MRCFGVEFRASAEDPNSGNLVLTHGQEILKTMPWVVGDRTKLDRISQTFFNSLPGDLRTDEAEPVRRDFAWMRSWLIPRIGSIGGSRITKFQSDEVIVNEEHIRLLEKEIENYEARIAKIARALEGDGE